MNSKFVVSHLDQQMGPFTEAELKTKWSKGELLPIDYVYDEGKKDWILLAERFEWATGKSEGAPPPLKPATDRKKLPPAPVADKPATPTPNMSQQKPAQSTIVIHTPILNLPGIQDAAPLFVDPLPDVVPAPAPVAPPAPVVAIAPPAPAPVAHHDVAIPTPVPAIAPAQVTLVNGVGEIDMSLENPGQVEFLLQNSSAGNLKLHEPLKVQVLALAPEEITWNLTSQQTVGEDLEIQFRAVDGRGTLCTHFSEEFFVQIGGSEPRTLSLVITAGVGSLKLQNTKAEKWEVALTYKGSRALRLPSLKFVDWFPGPAARLILDGPPDLIAGNPLKVQVKAVDQYGNLASTFQGTVVLEVKAS